MKNINHDVRIETLNEMTVAVFRVISKNPEEESEKHAHEWLRKNNVIETNSQRKFGFNVEISKDQKIAGLRGYEYWITVPENTIESDGIVIKNIKSAKYAVLRIADPFQDPFKFIPAGWQTLQEYVRDNKIAANLVTEQYCLEEVLKTEDGTFMDLFTPIM